MPSSGTAARQLIRKPSSCPAFQTAGRRRPGANEYGGREGEEVVWGWSKPTSPGGLVGQSALCLARETRRGLLRQKGLDEEEPERTEK